MWKYINQIKIRWASVILFFIILVFSLFLLKNELTFSQTGMKVLLTRLQVSFENLPIWYYGIIIIASIIILLIGTPSACILFPLMLLKNCTFAFIVTTFCQITATLLAMWISYKKTPILISDNLKKKIEDNRESYQDFAFWSRIYYNIPLRTIDSLTPIVHDNKEGLYNSLIAASCSIMIRLCIPSLLIKHIIDQFTVLEPNPELEYTKLLIWGSILIIYTVLPKVPELMICPNKVKKVILEIENSTQN